MSNIESFNVVRGLGLTKSNFLIWTGLRKSVPLKLLVKIPNFKIVFDLDNFKCHDYYRFLIKQKLEKSSKWVNLKEKFKLEEKQVSAAFLMPVRIAMNPTYAPFSKKC